MKCPLEFEQSAELIVGYGARTLDPDTTAAFERHIDSCAKCGKVAAAQVAVWAALDDVEYPTTVSPDFDRRLLQRIEKAQNRGRWLWHRLIPAAACAGVVTIVLLFNQPDSVPPPHAQPQPTLQIEQVEHALDDMDLLSRIDAASSSKRL